jgi:hypothetical protein
MKKPRATPKSVKPAVKVEEIERVQLGVRMEKRMVKVLKAVAEAADMTLGEMLEDIVIHAFEGESTFSDPKVLALVKDFKRLYGMIYDVHAHYKFPRELA